MSTGFHFEEGMPWIIFEPQDILVIVPVMGAAIALDIFLALKEDGRLGLVLPGLWLLGVAVKLVVWIMQVSRYSSVSARGKELCIAVLVTSIPALLLLAAYGLCRLCKRWKTVRQLKKTRIEDL